MAAWAIVGGALVVTVLVALVGHGVGRRRARGSSAEELAAARARVAQLEAARAALEERERAVAAESERWRSAASNLEACLAEVEREKTRLDYELRQVGLAASRVPQLEEHVFELARTQAALSEARQRLEELESVADELELRQQYIHSLQRELSHRDERLLAFEQQVEHLTAAAEPGGAGVHDEAGQLLPAGAMRSARPASHPELTKATRGEPGDPGPGRLPAAPGGGGGDPGPGRFPAAPVAVVDELVASNGPTGRYRETTPLRSTGSKGRSALSRGADEPAHRAGAVVESANRPGTRRPAEERRVEIPAAACPAEPASCDVPRRVGALAAEHPADTSGAADREEPTRAKDPDQLDSHGPAPVGRALQQALHGLGVRSFADLDVFDASHGPHG